VDELALKHEGCIRLDPAARLAMAVGQLCLAVDAANRTREAGVVLQASAAAAQPVKEETVINISREDFADL
jgi:hypothetical protein